MSVSEKLQILNTEYHSPEYKRALALRYRLLRKLPGLHYKKEDLQKEVRDIHITALEEHTVLGVLIITPLDSERVQIRQVAVSEESQASGIGWKIMEYAEREIFHRGYHQILLNARSPVVGFYSRLGFFCLW